MLWIRRFSFSMDSHFAGDGGQGGGGHGRDFGFGGGQGGGHGALDELLLSGQGGGQDEQGLGQGGLQVGFFLDAPMMAQAISSIIFLSSGQAPFIFFMAVCRAQISFSSWPALSRTPPPPQLAELPSLQGSESVSEKILNNIEDRPMAKDQNQTCLRTSSNATHVGRQIILIHCRRHR